MAVSDLTARTHPRRSGIGAQLVVLLVALVLGVGIAGVLYAADQRSWRGSTDTIGTVTGRDDTGVLVSAVGRTVHLHLAKVPTTGTTLRVEVSPDGRARPSEFRQTWGKALRSGIGLAVLLALLLQAYRYVVTRRSDG